MSCSFGLGLVLGSGRVDWIELGWADVGVDSLREAVIWEFAFGYL